MSTQKIRVLVVDDSTFAVSVISKKLGEDPELQVIGTAHNGKEAIEKIKELKPDVVTLDIAMPVMDGMSALETIMEYNPVPVIMLSALTSENAEITLRALEIGAVDFFLKPSILSPAGDGESTGTLIEKIKLAAKIGSYSRKLSSRFNNLKAQEKVETSLPIKKLVVIGSSTGGPRALMEIVPELPADIPASILIVQHMPPVFTKSLAERLNSASKLKVKEASQDDSIEQGQVLVAPGGYHMKINMDKKVELTKDPPVLGVRPSVDVTMQSAVEVFGNSVIGVILTGMHTDGTYGASLIKRAGGKVLTQDESTSAVFGMPKSVISAGYADKIVPIHKMAGEIVRFCTEEKTLIRGHR